MTNGAQSRSARGLTATPMIAHISAKVPISSQQKPAAFVLTNLSLSAGAP